MEDKRKQDTKSLNFRIPAEIHKVLKNASYYSDKSINKIIIELILYGFSEWVDYNMPEIDGSEEDGYYEDLRIKMIEGMEETISRFRSQVDKDDIQRNMMDE